MKWMLLLIFSLLLIEAKTQLPEKEKRKRVELNPAELARDLTIGHQSEIEKVRAIFDWITANISYRTGPSPRNKNEWENLEEDDTGFLKPLDERVAETVLENRVAVCDGYARLFKSLCSHAGIRAEVIHGYGKTEPARVHQRFNANHSWNAVMIDGSWKLLDVTWASGYLTRQGGGFVRKLDEQYFLSPPEQFIREHFPDDIRWSLMEDPPLMPEFRYSPFKQKAFIKYRISSFRPSRGVIEASLGDTLEFTVQSSDIKSDQNISSDPFLDTSIYSTPFSALLVPPGLISRKTVYTYVVNVPTVKWLYVLYNDDIILRYKLEIRNNKPGHPLGKN